MRAVARFTGWAAFFKGSWGGGDALRANPRTILKIEIEPAKQAAAPRGDARCRPFHGLGGVL